MSVLTQNEQTKRTNKLIGDITDLINEYLIGMGISNYPTIGVVAKVDKSVLGLRELVAVANTTIDLDTYPSGLTTRSRKRYLVMRRQVAAHIGRQLGYHLQLVGRSLYIDHATVIHSCNLVDSLLKQKDPEMVQAYEEIYTAVNNYHKEKYGKDLSGVSSTGLKS